LPAFFAAPDYALIGNRLASPTYCSSEIVSGRKVLRNCLAGMFTENQLIFGKHAGQTITQHFAAHRKRLQHHGLQRLLIARQRRFQRNHPHDGRFNPWRRIESRRRHDEAQRHRIAPLQHHRQPPIALATGWRDHAFDHFFLQHEMLILHQCGKASEMEQQRAGDVVGQVANHTQLLSGRHRQRAEVKLQRIARMDQQFFRIEGFLQAHDQVAVEFDHMQLVEVIEQQARHRAKTGADFDHGIGACRYDGLDNVLQDLLVGQKILAEAFAGYVFHPAVLILRPSGLRCGLPRPCCRGRRSRHPVRPDPAQYRDRPRCE
jgi:hypothetical protein